MNKSKRFLAILMAALTALALALPAFADVILEPRSSFYDKHSNECVHSGYHRYVPKEGGVKVWNEPEGKAKYSIDSGRFASQWTYTDGEGNKWGYIEDYSADAKDGWFRMDEALRLYDHTDFEKDHSKEIYADSEEHSFTAGVLYVYPNGPVKETVNLNAEQPSYSDFFMAIVFNNCYRDENGREWGFIGYRFGRRDAWVCIDDPENAELSAAEIPVFDGQTGQPAGTVELSKLTSGLLNGAEPTAEPDPDATPEPPTEHTDPLVEHNKWLITAAVLAAAAVSAAVLALVFKKPKQE